MTKLRELTDYKNEIINRIISKQNIVKAISYQERDFLDKDDVEDIESLIFSNIYPFNFIPSSEEELKKVKSYITLSMTDYRPSGGTYFNASNIFIHILMHKDLFRTDYGFLRTDYLAAEIHELMDKQRGVGLGKLNFSGAKETSINSDYHGIRLQYSPTSFN